MSGQERVIRELLDRLDDLGIIEDADEYDIVPGEPTLPVKPADLSPDQRAVYDEIVANMEETLGVSLPTGDDES